MRAHLLLAIALILLSAGCSRELPEKGLTIVNAAAVDGVLLERVRVFAEAELNVPVRTVQNSRLAGKGDLEALSRAAGRVKGGSDVILIVLAGVNGESRHLAVYPEKALAVINAQPLYTDDAERFARRIERQVMRAAAFAAGLPSTPDPFCVTRDYRSLDDLDTMGRNFSPPWQGRFSEAAAALGLAPKEVVRERSIRTE